ncbi:hypothetical protein FTO60_17395 (plasmid) [Octadecabacter sp. SW4]|uniref:hypothetical protein n=1 Tax=Octadecabacter sp. SW4 TaxID=2602067 RepID=UPI0011C1D262|nr:hypothetical protein [Octadecabacter sp. SW4]QEE37540.1 hypothetical protein FTO60_17395 [Octadecabacter sp. SW4]
MTLATAALFGCTDAQTNRATSDRLAELRSLGVDQEALAQADERLNAALSRDDATGALVAEFAEDPAVGSGRNRSNFCWAGRWIEIPILPARCKTSTVPMLRG